MRFVIFASALAVICSLVVSTVMSDGGFGHGHHGGGGARFVGSSRQGRSNFRNFQPRRGRQEGGDSLSVYTAGGGGGAGGGLRGSDADDDYVDDDNSVDGGDDYGDGEINLDMLRDAIPGEPGQDYNILLAPPEDLEFDCSTDRVHGGFYADTSEESKCQVFHRCIDGGETNGWRTESFVCPIGAIFDQSLFVCVWWFQFDCNEAEGLYGLNDELAAEAGGDSGTRSGDLASYGEEQEDYGGQSDEPAPGSYGGPTRSASSGYGEPAPAAGGSTRGADNFAESAAGGYGSPTRSAGSDYGSPTRSAISNYGQPDESAAETRGFADDFAEPAGGDYGSPAASDYGSPAAADYGSPAGTGYGEPGLRNDLQEQQSPPVYGEQQQDQYSSGGAGTEDRRGRRLRGRGSGQRSRSGRRGRGGSRRRNRIGGRGRFQ